jgi:two-component system, cell cycle sensor histidine kinase and response regulator CckA
MTVPRIMIVEDESIVSMQITDKLEAMGYEVVGTVRSGEEALERAEQLRPDLILMDIRLAGEIDGITAASKIRGALKVPLIYLTAQADEHTLSRAQLTMPQGYLIKPFSRSDLRTVVEKALRNTEFEEESVELISSPLSILGEGAIVTDQNGTVIYMNSIAEDLTGWSLAEAEGKSLTEVFSVREEGGSSIGDMGSSVISKGLGVAACYFGILASRDNSAHPVDYSVLPVQGIDGGLSRAVIAMRSPTDDSTEESEWTSSTTKLYLAGLLCCAEGDYPKAQSFYEKALPVLEMNLDRDHPRIAGMLRNLADVYRKTGRDGEADRLEERASRMRSFAAIR